MGDEAEVEPIDNERLRVMAKGLVQSIAPSHDGSPLIEDMVQAAWEWLVKHGQFTMGPYTHLDIRKAMIDEMFYWLVGVTAGQKPRVRYDVPLDAYVVGQWTVSSHVRLERQIMSRECIRRIFDMIKETTRQSLSDAMVTVFFGELGVAAPSDRYQTKSVFNARKRIRSIIQEYLPA